MPSAGLCTGHYRITPFHVIVTLGSGAGLLNACGSSSRGSRGLGQVNWTRPASDMAAQAACLAVSMASSWLSPSTMLRSPLILYCSREDVKYQHASAPGLAEISTT